MRCDEPAVARAFWPGHHPLYLCEHHVKRASAVAQALGMYLHMEPAEPETLCTQVVPDGPRMSELVNEGG